MQRGGKAGGQAAVRGLKGLCERRAQDHRQGEGTITSPSLAGALPSAVDVQAHGERYGAGTAAMGKAFLKDKKTTVRCNLQA